MFTRSSRWIHLLIISSEPWSFHEEFPLSGKWSLSPSPWATDVSWWWQVQHWPWQQHLDKHHDDADQQEADQDETEVDEQVLEILTCLLRHLNGGSSSYSRAGEVLDFLHDSEGREVWSFKGSRERGKAGSQVRALWGSLECRKSKWIRTICAPGFWTDETQFCIHLPQCCWYLSPYISVVCTCVRAHTGVSLSILSFRVFFGEGHHDVLFVFGI